MAVQIVKILTIVFPILVSLMAAIVAGLWYYKKHKESKSGEDIEKIKEKFLKKVKKQTSDEEIIANLSDKLQKSYNRDDVEILEEEFQSFLDGTKTKEDLLKGE